MHGRQPQDNFPMPYTGSAYKTPASIRRPLSCLFPNLSFYWRMFMIVRLGGAKAAADDYNAEDWIVGSAGIVRALEYCGGIFEISGMENFINLPGPCVFVGNHMSTLETFVLPCLIQPHRDVTFVVKESLLRYPWFGHLLGSRDPIKVARKDPRADLAAMLQGGAERLAEGRSLIVFPQGSRSALVEPEHFNSIGVKIAKRAGVPAIPVAVRTDAWGNGNIFKDFGAIRPELGIHFKFGPAMEISGNGKAAHQEILRFIQNNLTAWGLQQPAYALEQGDIRTNQ
ncbi:MAG: 1-acyl-sn-glycerol-3-phosphate acyltransferase [Desulfovibrionaceae bacterium]|nr:1-acyl-sn-glycerol-3-phosphate acyltransferase [Desulfovibrionaceae bacterium]